MSIIAHWVTTALAPATWPQPFHLYQGLYHAVDWSGQQRVATTNNANLLASSLTFSWYISFVCTPLCTASVPALRILSPQPRFRFLVVHAPPIPMI
ncbi:hypothetical protein DE146DRAFT_668391 [Phaeosphaeria sp. MPI-PUGE-AT-0046c]|nr:hypothetical protein DE146DRAFT_668391 [Phaeosphaeria sp. MPI-PUGE-AT-0046c]